MQQPRVAVIGGGVTGLVAAARLARLGAAVTLLEADDRLGGQVRTVAFRGVPVDVGAEALHTAAPQVLDLVGSLGLTDRLVRARTGASWIWMPHGLRPLPAGVGPAGPTRLGPVLRARVLSVRGMARAALEPVVARPVGDDDQGVGTFVARHFGAEVCDRLVDPLLGSLHAGDVHRLSLQAATPQLAAMARGHRSLLLAHRARRSGPAPTFVSFPGGLAELVDRLAAGVPAVCLGTRATAVARVGSHYRVELGGGPSLEVDGIVLAMPAHAAAPLLQPVAPVSAGGLGGLRAATVATVVVAFPPAAGRADGVLRGNGVLVPARSGRTLKAATFLSAKWPQLDAAGAFLVRLSAGRAGSSVVDDHDDGALVDALLADLADIAGLRADPLEVHVERWPRSIAQLEVGHLPRLRAIRAALPSGVLLAGAPYEGIGIAACVSSGQRAADALLDVPAPSGAPA